MGVRNVGIFVLHDVVVLDEKLTKMHGDRLILLDDNK